MTDIIDGNSQARLPRFERQPRAIPNFEITPRDEEILLSVARHRFIRSSRIVDLLAARHPGTSEQKILRRLQLLFHAGYVLRPKVQVDPYRAGAGSQKMVYMLGNRGADLLAAKYGFRRAGVDWTAKARTTTRGQITHALEVTDVMVALAVACCRRGTHTVVYFDEIMRELAPEATRAKSRPYYWPVTVPWRGQNVKTYVIPDKLFGIRDLRREPGRDCLFLMLEADRGTMPVVRSNLAQSSVLRKILGYSYTFRGGLHKRLYGLPNMRVLITTTGRDRIDGIIDAYRTYAAGLVEPRVFLMAHHRRLIEAEDFFAYPWLDGAGVEHRLG
jgi:hypothetical protein